MAAQLGGFPKNCWVVYIEQVAFMVCRLSLNKAVRETKGLSHTLRGLLVSEETQDKKKLRLGGGNRKGSPAAVVGNGVPAWDVDKDTELRPLFLDFQSFG